MTAQDYERIIKLIEGDCEFLRKKGIIDYSLLVGIYEKERALSIFLFLLNFFSGEENSMKKKFSITDEIFDEDEAKRAKEIDSDSEFKKALRANLSPDLDSQTKRKRIKLIPRNLKNLNDEVMSSHRQNMSRADTLVKIFIQFFPPKTLFFFLSNILGFFTRR